MTAGIMAIAKPILIEFLSQLVDWSQVEQQFITLFIGMPGDSWHEEHCQPKANVGPISTWDKLDVKSNAIEV